jgi:hypothetical protein
MSHKVNKQIEVTYQAAGAQSGLTDVTMVIYDETHSLDGVNFPDVTMTEIGSSGRYYGAFTPDAEGEWNVLINSATAPGKVVKHYNIIAHDVDSVGDAVGGLNDLSSSDVAGELATYDAPTKAELDTAESNIRGTDADTLKSISDQIDALPQTAPPMVG